MAKPFKVTSPAAVPIGRMPNGQFQRLEAPSPPQIRKEALEEGEPIDQVLRERRVPHHPVGSATPKEVGHARKGEDHPQGPVYDDAVPWPPAGPVNDADRPPMKLNR